MYNKLPLLSSTLSKTLGTYGGSDSAMHSKNSGSYSVLCSSALQMKYQDAHEDVKQ